MPTFPPNISRYECAPYDSNQLINAAISQTAQILSYPFHRFLLHLLFVRIRALIIRLIIGLFQNKSYENLKYSTPLSCFVLFQAK